MTSKPEVYRARFFNLLFADHPPTGLICGHVGVSRYQSLLICLISAAIDRGKLFRRVNKFGKTWGEGITEKAVWHIVMGWAKTIGIAKLAPHDLRRTCARLCHASGGELEQIQFLLGHVSVQTTERYLGCKQRIRSAVNDCIGIEPSP
jgi:integrase